MTGALLECELLVTNDTGPMHLAAALDRPILAVEGAADVRQTRPLARRVRLVGRFDLPCVPCVRNRCPRRGAGFELREARLECMHLITVEEVLAQVRAMLLR
jgi:ADP-heptose:LPS heptosyltransferase